MGAGIVSCKRAMMPESESCVSVPGEAFQAIFPQSVGMDSSANSWKRAATPEKGQAKGAEYACPFSRQTTKASDAYDEFDLPGGVPQMMEGAAFEFDDVSDSHLDAWSDKGETLIVFDWDDTLYPTTFEDQRAKNEHAVATERKEAGNPNYEGYIRSLKDILRIAANTGAVRILTMAAKGWVQTCLQRTCPEILELFKELDIKVIEARVIASTRHIREACADGRDPSHYLKSLAIKRLVREFYQQGTSRSWKNIISVGDSHAERLALQDVVFRHQQRDRLGRWKDCRCKTVKLQDEPALEDIVIQLRVVRQWLPTLAHHDGDIDMDFDELDLELN